MRKNHGIYTPPAPRQPWFYRDGHEFEGVCAAVGDRTTINRKVKCPKCGGQGGHEVWARTGWTCYRCGGAGWEHETVTLYSAEKLNKLNDTLVKTRLRREANKKQIVAEEKAQAHMDCETGNPKTYQILMDDPTGFNSKMIDHLNAGKSLSESQINAIIRIHGEKQTRTATEARFEGTKSCPEGRFEVTGVVLSTKVQDGQYGMQFKMLLKCDGGFKIWGTIPAGVRVEDKGVVITIKTTITPSPDDKQFGFFKRPKLVEVHP